MVEIGEITRDQARLLLDEVPGELVRDERGAIWEKGQIRAYIQAADKWQEWSGVGHFLQVRMNDTWFKWDLLS